MSKISNKKELDEKDDSRDPIMVSIRCIAYNQEKFIRDTLEGFVMQKTNFRFEAIVHDDASTDGTANIIREYAAKYPDIIKPIIETENQWSKHDGSLHRIMSDACKGKYIAFCEGDDYWTDPLKLQKQVDILEANKDISFVHSAFHTIDQDGNKMDRPVYEKMMRNSPNGYVFMKLYRYGNYILTCTVCMRREVIDCNLLRDSPLQLDYMTFLIAAYLGKAFYMPEKTAAYRCNPNSLVMAHSKMVDKTLTDINRYITVLIWKGKIRSRASTNYLKLYYVALRKALHYLKEDVKKWIGVGNN